MKLKIISDLHVEFGFDHTLIKNNGEDVIVLAGDIGVGPNMTSDILKYFSKEFPNVIYVLGNHEFYNHDINTVATVIKYNMSEFQNVHILDRDTVLIDGVTFIGATLWTSFKRSDPFVMQYCSRSISDFQSIKNKDKSFSTSDAADKFYQEWGYIRTCVKTTKTPVVIVTHFLPSEHCIHPRYRGESVLNHYFANELGDDIVDFDNVPLWIFGHTHDFIDISIGKTRCIANPYGYHTKENYVDSSDAQVLNFVVEV